MFHKRLLPLLCCLLLLPFHMAWAENPDAAPVTVAYGGQSIVAQEDGFYCMLPHEDGIHRVLARYDPFPRPSRLCKPSSAPGSCPRRRGCW